MHYEPLEWRDILKVPNRTLALGRLYDLNRELVTIGIEDWV